MSISAPPGQPSITETLGSSFRDAFSLVKTNAVPVALLLALTAIDSIVLVTTGSIRPMWAAVIAPATTNANGSVPPAVIALMALTYLLVLVINYYSLAAAVRTIHPEFRMTLGRFFGSIGYTLLAGLLMMVAGLFFVIPAYWVGPKVLLMPYTYLLTGGSGGVLKTTWDMTTGYYWQTVGMLLLAGLCVAIIVDGACFICVLLTGAAPPAAIVLYPLAMAILVWTMHLVSLVYVRWTNGLLPRAGMPQGAAAVPA